MPTHEITCADCGHEHLAKRKHARYCNLCRLFRNLVYLGARKQRCVSCEERYAPLDANDKLCAECDFGREAAATGACAICEAPSVPLVVKGIALCIGCAKDPERRDLVTRALGKKRRQRQEARG